MPSTSQKTGRFLAKALGIKLETHDDKVADAVTRGESVFSIQTSDTFVEPPPTAAEWVRDVLPSGPELISYTRSLFPFTYWIGRYNLQWLFGDLVAGEFISPVCHISEFSFNFDADDPRYYYRSRGSSSEHGLCWTGPACPSVRSLFVVHGCPSLLVLRYI